MPDLQLFRNVALPGGLVLTRVALADESLFDPLGRPALARTIVVGNELEIILLAAQSEDEFSISL